MTSLFRSVYACIESLNCSKSLYCTDVSSGMVSRGIINDSMEFETLPVGQGDVLVRGPSRPVRGGTPDGPGGTLFYQNFQMKPTANNIKIPDGPGGTLFLLEFSHKTNSKSLTDWEGPFLILIPPFPSIIIYYNEIL